MKFLVALVAALMPAAVAAKAVVAHVIVGVYLDHTIELWKQDIELAKQAGIDAFALNIATPWNGAGGCATQMSFAFQAANQLGFKLFVMFDYLGGTQGAWPASDIRQILQDYGPNGAMFKYNNRPLVTTFEGGDHLSEWASIRAAVPGDITFVPNMMGLGPSGVQTNINAIDGFFSWDMWPKGPNDMTTAPDQAWRNALSAGSNKIYMMGVSPWFYTKLPNYGKAWVWRGDSLWHQRWQQAVSFQPDIVHIVTWNDYGESSYIGPIFSSGIPSSPGADARPYVNNMPHDAWRQLLPYYINQYKTGSTAVATEKLVYWYRLSSASAGSADGVTGNNCPSPINKFPSETQCFAPGEISQDRVFFTALVKSVPATVTVQVGGAAVQSYAVNSPGAFHASQAFNGQTGVVTVKLVRGGQTVLTGAGAAIQASASGGVVNFNAWVGGLSA